MLVDDLNYILRYSTVLVIKDRTGWATSISGVNACSLRIDPCSFYYNKSTNWSCTCQYYTKRATRFLGLLMFYFQWREDVAED